MASPFINPSAKYWFETARNTGTPRPLTPIMDAMTTIATGGFSTHNDSIGFFENSNIATLVFV